MKCEWYTSEALVEVVVGGVKTHLIWCCLQACAALLTHISYHCLWLDVRQIFGDLVSQFTKQTHTHSLPPPGQRCYEECFTLRGHVISLSCMNKTGDTIFPTKIQNAGTLIQDTARVWLVTSGFNYSFLCFILLLSSYLTLQTSVHSQHLLRVGVMVSVPLPLHSLDLPPGLIEFIWWWSYLARGRRVQTLIRRGGGREGGSRESKRNPQSWPSTRLLSALFAP